MANITRIKNNQITDSTITVAKLAAGTLTGGAFASNLTLNSNVTILGNLTITGTPTTIQSTNTYVNDPLVVFNNGYVGTPSYDIGIIANRNLQNLAPYGSVNTAFVWKEADAAFEAITTTETGTTTGSINNSGWANVKVGNLTSVSSSVTGALTVGSTLGVTGAAALSSTLSVTGATTLTTASLGGLQALAIGNVTPGTGAFTTLVATTVNAATVGNIGANVVGTGTYLTALTASNINGTVATANVSLYDSITATTTNATFYPQVMDKTTGNVSGYSVASFSINPSTGALSATTFNGAVVGTTGTFSSTLGVTGATTLTTATTGGLQAVAIGNVTPGTGAFTTLTASSTLGVTGATTLTTATTGGLQAVAIGNVTPGSGAFTTLTSSGTIIASGNIVAGSGVASTSTTTGALISTGGAGIAGALYAGSAYDNGTRVITGLTSSGAGNVTIAGTNPSLTIALPATGAGAATVGSATQLASITTDIYGRVVASSQTALSSSAVTNLGNTTEITANASVGLTGLNLTTTGVTAGNYGSATAIPTIVVDSKGRVTSITTNAASTSFNLAGTSGTGTISAGGTLTFASTNGVLITAGTSYANISTPQDVRTTANPTFNNATLASLQATAIGNATPGSGAFTTLTASSTLGVTGATTLTTATTGGLQAVAIGNVTPGTAQFTTLTAQTETVGGLQAVAIGNVTPGTAVFTTATTGGLQAVAIGNVTPGSGAFTTGTFSSTLGVTGATTLTTATTGGLQAVAIGNVTPGSGAFTTLTVNSTSNHIGAATFTTATTGGLQAVAIGNVTPGTGAFTTGTFSSTLGVTGATTLTTATAGGIQSLAIGNVTPGSGAFTTLGATGQISATNNTDATSTGTGAVVVTGGVGIGGNLWVGGNIYAGNIIATTQNILTIVDPLLYLQASNPNGQYNYDIGLYSDYSAPGYRHSGLARNFNANTWTFFSNVASEPSATTINWNDAGIAYDTVKAGSLILANTTASTSSTTGALQVAGGVGIAGSLYVGGSLTTPSINATPIGNATPSTGAFTTLSSTGTTTLALTTAAAINSTPIGNATPSTGAFTTLVAQTETVGGLQAVAIGNVTPGTAVFTTLSATGTTTLTTATTGGLQAVAIGNVTPGTAVFTTETVGGLQAVAIGNVTPGTGAFTTVTAQTETVGGLQAVAIGNVTPGTGAFTTLSASSTLGVTGATTLTTATTGGLQAVAIGNVTPGTAQFTTLGASGATTLNTVTGASFQGVIGNVTPAAATFTTVTAQTETLGGLQAVAIGNVTPGTGAFTTVTATTVNAATIGNVGTSLNGTGTNITSLTAANLIGTAPTANVSLYDSITATTTNATFYPQLVDKATGNVATYSAANFTVNPSTGALSATSFNGAVVGTTGTFSSTLGVTGATTLTTATTGGLQAVAIGNATPGTGAFTTLTAQTETLGGLQAVAIGNVTPGTGAFTTFTTTGTIIANGNIVANSYTPSTSTTTGAIVIPFAGGLGVGGNLNAGVYGTSLHNIQGNILFGRGSVVASTDSVVTINLNTDAPLLATNNTIHLSGLTGRNATYGADSFGTSALSSFLGRKARGTSATPTAVQASDIIGGIYFRGYGATGYTSAANNPAGISVVAAENFTDTAQGAFVAISTISPGSVNAGVAVKVEANGNVVLNSATASNSTTTGALVVKGGAGIAGNIYASTNINAGAGLFGVNATLSNSVAVQGTQDTTSIGTGALTVAGGASILGNTYVGTNLYVGNGSLDVALTNPTVVAVDNGASYAQSAILNQSAYGSADFIAYPNNYAGPASDHGWADLGFTGGNFNDPNYTITKPHDAYLFGSGVSTSGGGNLVLATDSTGSYNDIVIGVGSFYSNSEVARFHGNTSTGGYLQLSPTTAATSATTGAVRVAGGLGVAGNVWFGNAVTINSTQTANQDFKVYGVNSTNLLWARPSSTYEAVVVGNTIAAGSLTSGAKLQVNSTDSILLPIGTQAQRPSGQGYADVAGMLRFSTQVGSIEWYTGSQWQTATTAFTTISDLQFNGDSATTDFALGSSTSTASTIVSINGIVQIPTLAYSVVSSSTLRFTEAPANGDVIDVRILQTTTGVSGITSTNGYMGFAADNNGSYVYTNTGQATTYWDPNGAQVSAVANVAVATANTATTVDSWSNSTYRTAKYIVQITNGANYQSMEALVIQNGTTATIVPYGTVQTGGNLGILSATVSGGNTLVQFVAANATNNVRIKKDYMLI